MRFGFMRSSEKFVQKRVSVHSELITVIGVKIRPVVRHLTDNLWKTSETEVVLSTIPSCNNGYSHLLSRPEGFIPSRMMPS